MIDTDAVSVTALETAVRLRDEQLAVLAHDLRGPLSSILMLLERVREEVNAKDQLDAAKIRPNLDQVARRLDAYTQQIGKLLDGAKLRAGGLPDEPVPLELVEVVREITEQLRGALFRPPVITFTGVEAVTGKWDRTGLDQIVRNVIHNALQFGDGKPVEIDVACDSATCTLSVRDHGPGIKPEDRARAFEPHVKLVKGKGFGLGLWIARRTAEAMGGTITVEGASGGGAQFTVTLPRRPTGA